jgi:carbonic anhydrase
MSVIDTIRNRQRIRPDLQINKPPPEHKPEILLIGCIDARVDLVGGLGIEQGKALIYRNPGAQVRPYSERAASAENMDIAATLEISIDVMRVKDIVIMGHTHCGAIGLCDPEAASKIDEKTLPSLFRYLAPIRQLWGMVTDAHDHSKHEVEDASVRRSIENLRSYPPVARALAEGRLKLHGWVIDINNSRLCEYCPDSDAFVPMTNRLPA